MKIKILNTQGAFDPQNTANDYDASLSAFETELDREIHKDYPNAEIEFYRSQEQYDAPSKGFQVFGEFDDYRTIEHLEDEIQKIGETVYETGNFWE